MYIGQSVNIEKRWLNHRAKLEKNKHANKHLQNAWNKYGSDNFKFAMIEECDIQSLNEREIFWISKYKTTTDDKGYNMQYGGSTGLHTEEYKEHMKIKMKGNTNGGAGETCGRSRITEEQAIRIVYLLLSGQTPREIQEETNISLRIIRHIKQKESWVYLTKDIKFDKENNNGD